MDSAPKSIEMEIIGKERGIEELAALEDKVQV